MTNLVDQLLQIAANPSSASTVFQDSLISSITSKTQTSDATFQQVLVKVNSVVTNSQVQSSYGSTGYENSLLNNISSYFRTNVDVSSIVQKINSNPDQLANVDYLVEQYLMTNFGGSRAEVIRRIANVKILPIEAKLMSYQMFNQLVSRLSSQVRDQVRINQNGSVLSGNLETYDLSMSDNADMTGSILDSDSSSGSSLTSSSVLNSDESDVYDL